MRKLSKQRYLAGILLLATITALVLAVHQSKHTHPPHSSGPGVIDALLSSQPQTSAYRLVPESTLTGLCWYADDGSKQGVFKDVNDGVSQWRYREPMDRAGYEKTNPNTAVQRSDGFADLITLSHELDDIAFEATAFSIANGDGSLSGTLYTRHGYQQVSLNLRLPLNSAVTEEGRNSIDVIASTTESINGILDLSTYGLNQPVHLCLISQAARQSAFPEPSSGKPLLLSHYY